MSVVIKNYSDLRLGVALSTDFQTRIAPVRLAKLRKERHCEQVAAVCYRERGGAIEFLLVQTRGSRRWTFPKGKAEAGLSHAQAAAIEAFEEAGVHGRMEEASFVRYFSRSKSAARGTAVSAHLCEVLRLCPPKEGNRNRTWFSVREAKERLREGRRAEHAAEFTRVVGRAVVRIERVRGYSGAVRVTSDQAACRAMARGATEKDALQRVQFEAGERGDVRGTYRQIASSKVGGRTAVSYGEILEFRPQRQIEERPKLLSGAKVVKTAGK
jgi:8-oxo-dGTP pyrophosphatase MutT (NUDIX family)